MTGNTPTVLIGLGLISLVLPIGLLVLSRVNTTIEREHPFDLGPAPRTRVEAADLPVPRPAVGAESTSSSRPATPATDASSAGAPSAGATRVASS